VRPLALCYHGVARVPLRKDPHRLFTRPDDLRRQLDLLRSWGYELLRFGDWAARVACDGGDGCLALTFDDGHADNLHQLLPILAEHRAAATVFAVPGWLGRQHPDAPHSRVLSADELCELHAAGLEVGAHTVSHADLTTLAPDRAAAEIRDSRRALEDLVGAPVTSLAYPYGNATAATREAARAAGVLAACRDRGQGDLSDPLDLPREDMGNSSSLLGLRLKRAGVYMPAMDRLAARGVRRARLRALGALRRERPR
jgi:peptidoglycan/xylan/chitin deacetylase (PgdA/CDA1 family)